MPAAVPGQLTACRAHQSIAVATRKVQKSQLTTNACMMLIGLLPSPDGSAGIDSAKACTEPAARSSRSFPRLSRYCYLTWPRNASLLTADRWWVVEVAPLLPAKLGVHNQLDGTTPMMDPSAWEQTNTEPTPDECVD
jgi:hypothetical protein